MADRTLVIREGEYPWDRTPAETEGAWQTFQLYLAMGPSRTGRAVAEQTKHDEGTVSKWRTRYRWNDRAIAWDLEQDREYRVAQLGKVRAAGTRTANLAASGLAGLSVPVQRMIRHWQRSLEDGTLDIELARMNVTERVNLIARAAGAAKLLQEIERLALGASTENVAVMHSASASGENVIINNPEAAKLASQLFAALDAPDAGGLGEDLPGGFSETEHEGPLEDAPAP